MGGRVESAVSFVLSVLCGCLFVSSVPLVLSCDSVSHHSSRHFSAPLAESLKCAVPCVSVHFFSDNPHEAQVIRAHCFALRRVRCPI